MRALYKRIKRVEESLHDRALPMPSLMTEMRAFSAAKPWLTDETEQKEFVEWRLNLLAKERIDQDHPYFWYDFEDDDTAAYIRQWRKEANCIVNVRTHAEGVQSY